MFQSLYIKLLVITLLIFCTSSFGIILTIFPAFLNDKGMNTTDILYLYFAFGISRVVSLALAGQFAKRTSQTLIAATLAVLKSRSSVRKKVFAAKNKFQRTTAQKTLIF